MGGITPERTAGSRMVQSKSLFPVVHCPGICGILTLLVSMLTTGLSAAREREMGTFDQLLVTSIRPTEILLGKALPEFLVGHGRRIAHYSSGNILVPCTVGCEQRNRGDSGPGLQSRK